MRQSEPIRPPGTYVDDKPQPVPAPAALNRTVEPRKPFGYDLIHSNAGHMLGLDKASNIAETFNRTMSKVWGASTKAGSVMMNRGIKPTLQWAGEEYQSPYDDSKKKKSQGLDRNVFGDITPGL